MTVVLLVEGATETALKNHIKRFLDQRAGQEGKPRLALRIKPFRTKPTEKELRKRLNLELRDNSVEAVVGLLDVYPDFDSARDAKEFMRNAVGNNSRSLRTPPNTMWKLGLSHTGIVFAIDRRQKSPGNNPEHVNSMAPPSKRLEELYQIAKRKYRKPLEMKAILERQDLSVAAHECRELKLLLNTLLRLGGLTLL